MNLHFIFVYFIFLQPHLCSKLADDTSDFWSTLPLVQALLPGLSPYERLPRVVFSHSCHLLIFRKFEKTNNLD